tara:strand:- start:5376 stop:6293 length:918 start_codon:yes stop_codon:yes gene_type:complete
MKNPIFLDKNIQRVENFVQKYYSKKRTLKNGYPVFSSIEISLNGACNRRCEFCPRVSKKEYPNLYQSLDFSDFKKMIGDLNKINFEGRISFSGFCEPLLTKNINDYIKYIRTELPKVNIDMVSNGDVITKKNFKKVLDNLFSSGLNTIRLSLYDGPHQVDYFQDIKKELKLNDDQLITRKRYLGPEESFGITLCNRAGSVNLKKGNLDIKPLETSLNKACYIPFHKILIDYDGTVLMCANDWKKENPLGNIKNESIIDIWCNEISQKTRARLMNKDRSQNPCNKCDINGTLNGQKPFDLWKKILK